MEVSGPSFYQRANGHTKSISQIVIDNRKCLFIYDTYRSSMKLKMLEQLCENGVIACAIPSHTSVDQGTITMTEMR